MPRPQKEGLDYFPLDTDFLSSDKRIKGLLRKFGADGITFLVSLWCDIYGGSGYYVIADDDYLDESAHELGINVNTIRQIVGYLLSRSLFDNTLFQSVKVLTAPGIQRRYELAVKERVRKRKSPVIVEKDYWLLPEEEAETVSVRSGDTATSIKVIQFSVSPRNNSVIPRNNEVIPWNKCTKESKGKKSKGKESIEGEGEPPRSASGRYGNVLLTREEAAGLEKDFGQSVLEDYVGRLDTHIQKTGRRYSSHEATIRSWILEDRRKAADGKQQGNRFHNFDQRETDYDAILREEERREYGGDQERGGNHCDAGNAG